MRKLLISAVVALTALTGTAAPTLAETYFQIGPGGIYVGPGYRDYPRYRNYPRYRDDYYRYPRYHRDYDRPRKASCHTKKQRYYSYNADRWVTKSTRVCYR